MIIAETYLGINKERAKEVLKEALKAAKEVKYSSDKVKVITSIAEAYLKINKERTKEVLKNAFSI